MKIDIIDSMSHSVRVLPENSDYAIWIDVSWLDGNELKSKYYALFAGRLQDKRRMSNRCDFDQPQQHKLQVVYSLPH